jgi:hypothetical protein
MRETFAHIMLHDAVNLRPLQSVSFVHALV